MPTPDYVFPNPYQLGQAQAINDLTLRQPSKPAPSFLHDANDRVAFYDGYSAEMRDSYYRPPHRL